MTIYPPPPDSYRDPLKGGGFRFDENSSINENLFPLPVAIGKGGVKPNKINY